MFVELYFNIDSETGVLDPIFTKKFKELRESIFHGNVSDGVIQLGNWLMNTTSVDEQIEILLEITLLSLVCGDMEEAESRWSSAKFLFGNDHRTQRTEAYTAFFMVAHGRKKIGFTRFEECLLESPDAFEFYLLRGIAYSQQGMFEHAQADLDRANSLCPDNVLIMSTMADICVELGERDRAIALHESVLEASPDFRRSLMSLGVLYYDMERPDEAFRLFQCLVAYDPLNWFAWTCLGDIRLMQTGRTFQALPYYAAAIVSGSDDSLVYYNLVRGLFMLGRYDQALRLIDQFNPDPNGWDRQIRPSVAYLKLIGDIIKTSNFIKTDQFITRFKKLTPYNDEAGRILFYMLNITASLTYCETIQEIFGCHLAIFVYTARYISLCEGRVIQPEETTMLGVLTHMMISHGFMIEARAIINMLNKADEPRVIDMTAMLKNVLVRHLEIAAQTGVDLESFHEQLIKYPGAEGYFNFILVGEIDRIPGKAPWKNYLADALSSNDMQDISRVFFDHPGDSVIKTFEASLSQVTPEHASELRRTMWAGLKAYLEKSPERDHKAAGLPELQEICWQSLGDIFAKQDASAKESRQIQDGFSSLLHALAKRQAQLDSEDVIAPANDNTVQVCAAAPKEALSGFDPLPFAIDGTAFKKWMIQAETLTSVLDESALEDVWSKWMSKYYFCAKRSANNASVNTEASAYAKPLTEFTEQLKLFWQASRGQNPAVPKSNAKMTDIMKTAYASAFKQHAGAQSLWQTLSTDPSEPFQLPELPKFEASILYKHQEVPKYPKMSPLYARPIANNLLGQIELFEQFFNYAVTCVQSFLSPEHDNAHLKPFVEDDIFVFYRVDLDEQGRVQETIKEIPENAIRTPKELEQQLLLFHADFYMRDQSRNMSYRNVVCGCANHPFLMQFRSWARAHAKALWKQVAELEAQAREIREGSHYVVIWRIHDLLTRYPYLSRLYLMLAGIYAKLDMPEKVFKTLQAGLVWEDKLYDGCNWTPIHPDEAGKESALDVVDASTEFEEPQPLIWPERYVFQPRDEAMYHYGSMTSGFAMRCRRQPMVFNTLYRIVNNDKGGGYDFYRLFRKFIMRVPQLKDVYLQALATPGVYSLRDYLVYVISNMVTPDCFPLRRELAETLFAFYPEENPGALGRFYCDNLQPANALPLAAYAYYAETTDDETDDMTQSSVTLGCLLYDMGYMSEAMHFLEHAVHVKNPSPMAFLTKGCAHIEMREFDTAIECLKAGLKIDPSSDRFYYNMSLAYIEQGKLDEAEQTIKSGIALSPYPVDLNMQLMRIYVRKGQFVDALPLARYVASEDPDMFANALQFPEFDEFKKLPAVQTLLDECSFGGHS